MVIHRLDHENHSGMLTDLIGFAAGFLLALCFLPQVIQTWKSKRADDVSLTMLLLTLASAVLYEIYAWRLSLWPVIIMNGIFALLVAFELSLKLLFSRRHQHLNADN